MSVRERILDARLLIKHGRYEGALSQILIAVAATARKRFPIGTPSRWKPGEGMRDREAFMTFLDESLWEHTGITVRGSEGVLGVEYRGKSIRFERILYESFRCNLIHEAELPSDILFDGHPADAALTVQAEDSVNGGLLTLSRSWTRPLILAVVTAPENKGLFDDPAPPP